MKDADFAMLRRDLDTVWRRIKRDILKTVRVQPDRATLIELAFKNPELVNAMDRADGAFFREHYIRSMISDKAGPPNGRPPPSVQLDLFEIFEIHHPGQEATPKLRRALTKVDMEQIGRQKQGNISAAVHAKALWDWECALLFPVFDTNPSWLYWQCYDEIVTRLGHHPIPPKI